MCIKQLNMSNVHTDCITLTRTSHLVDKTARHLALLQKKSLSGQNCKTFGFAPKEVTQWTKLQDIWLCSKRRFKLRYISKNYDLCLIQCRYFHNTFAEPFPAFPAESTYLPICLDNAHVLYLSCNFKS